MEIVCFSAGRADRSLTPQRLPPAIAGRVIMCVPFGQGKAYVANGHKNVCETPEHVSRLPPRRQWWLEHTGADECLMLDDDVRFDTRRSDDNGKFLVATPEEVEALFNDISKHLEHYFHIGVTPREGGNRTGLEGRYIQVGRANRVHGYRLQVVRALGLRFDRTPCHEDMDMTLQLLRAGHPNLIINYMVQGHGQSNAPGGCSLYRTMELQTESARKLAELHRPHVTLVEKQTKTAWNGQPRLDVIVQWQRAYEEGKARASGIEQKELL